MNINELMGILNGYFSWNKSRMVFWDLLPKKGNSNTTERIKIIDRFIKQFGKTMIAGLLADREFVGDDWFNWLLTEGIPFCIRIKGNVITTNARAMAFTYEISLERPQ